MNQWISQVFSHEELLGMGHDQSVEDLNLGLGWLYYGFARVVRPQTVVVIGSYRGFTPLVFGKALADNGDGGRVCFIDPSMVDDHWQDEDRVRGYFADFGLENVDHHLMTTQDFVVSDPNERLGEVGILFVDGWHTAEQARFDYEAFRDRIPADGMTLFHDSVRSKRSRMYGPDNEYDHTVFHYMDELKKDPALQVLDVPFGDGVTVVRTVG